MTVDLSLRFEDNGTAHDDLVLRWNGRTHVADSYFLMLDDGVLPGREDPTKVRAVLRRLLEQWLDALRSLDDGESAYLPYDLSDQATCWLRCCRRADELDVAHGWSPVEGWSFMPSNVGDLIRSLDDFKTDEPEQTVSLDAFVDAVDRSRAAAGGAS